MLQPVIRPVRKLQINGMVESFVKTIKRDYIAHMPEPDRDAALRNVANAFKHTAEPNWPAVRLHRYGVTRCLTRQIKNASSIENAKTKKNGRLVGRPFFLRAEDIANQCDFFAVDVPALLNPFEL
jgi:hypothetical protein